MVTSITGAGTLMCSHREGLVVHACSGTDTLWLRSRFGWRIVCRPVVLGESCDVPDGGEPDVLGLGLSHSQRGPALSQCQAPLDPV